MVKDNNYSLKKLLIKYKFFVCVFCLLLVVGIVAIPKIFAQLQPVKSIEIFSEKLDYNSKEPGAWKVTKSAKWIQKGIAEITFDVDTVLKTNNKYNDIIFVLDISGSMSGDKIARVKSDTSELINSLLSNKKNKAGLITFDSTSEIVSELTSEKEILIEKVNSLSVTGCTNYYQALVNIDTMLKNYIKEEDRDCIVLFLTDGYPNEDIPNEEGQYQYLKNAYPYITVNGVQYEMGSDILDPIKKISDNQYIADMGTLNNVLFDASIAPITYDNFEITDFIDTNYFYVESSDDIKGSVGKITFDQEKQTVKWQLDTFKSGSKASMTIKAKLQDEYSGQGGVYPTNEKEEITSKIEEQEEDKTSTKTPVLADKYKVIYDGNAPKGCSVSGVPTEENHSVFDMIPLSEKVPKCEGYEFKGWNIVTKDVAKVNEDYFIMPESDIVIKATWGNISITKSMEGTVSVVQTFYKMMKSSAAPDDEKSTYVNSSTGIDFTTSPSNSNGKGVYQLASTKNNEYPILYYRGAVKNNNVKFGGFCWKIVRTTETGGVKLVYNGKPDENGNCTNTTGEITQIGTSKFNNYNNSPADVGYMYGNRNDYIPNFQSRPVWFAHIGKGTSSQTILSSLYMSTGSADYYGDSIGWDEENKQYNLKNSDGSELIQTTWSSDTYSSLKGKYRCESGTAISCTRVYYITDTISNYIYYKSLSNNQTLEDVNKIWNYGSEIAYENGVYTIQNSKELQEIKWYSNPLDKGIYVCPNGTTSCSNIWYIEAAFNSSMNYIPMENGETYDSLYQESLDKKWIYGNDVEWDGSKYTLKDTYESSPINWKNDYKTIATRYHYTCFSTEDNCTEVGYIHYFASNSSSIYHLKLRNGKNIEDAKKEMFINTMDSTIKEMIDTWYQSNMLEYADNLEDTIWCNDRSIDSGPLKGKDEDSSTNYLTLFGANGRNEKTFKPSVECPREEDRFTVGNENGNGMLTYPVALLTADELTLAGHGSSGYSSSSYLYTQKENWFLSPRDFYDHGARGFRMYSGGSLGITGLTATLGVRPSLSLAPSSIVASGDGTATNPFTVDMNY